MNDTALNECEKFSTKRSESSLMPNAHSTTIYLALTNRFKFRPRYLLLSSRFVTYILIIAQWFFNWAVTVHSVYPGRSLNFINSLYPWIPVRIDSCVVYGKTTVTFVPAAASWAQLDSSKQYQTCGCSERTGTSARCQEDEVLQRKWIDTEVKKRNRS